MNGSIDSQPPRLTPRIGCDPYGNGSFKGGTLSFGLAESSQVEFKPMIERPPTVSFVNVTLKPFVSYHVQGSRYVPWA